MLQIFSTWPHPARCLALLVTAFACGCTSAEPKMVGGMTGVVYNYSQETFVLIKLNGKTVGTGTDKVKVGDVTGGGGGMCCTSMPLGATKAEVALTTAKGEMVTVTAPVEKWWPDLAEYAVLHLLPGRKVVVEIRSTGVHARRDLQEVRIKELGLTKEVELPLYGLNNGPHERAGKGE